MDAQTKADALEALLRWLTEPQYILRWGMGCEMSTFILSHLDDYVTEWAIDKDVKAAAKRVKAKVAQVKVPA
jgi:hypothetical protein